jgi:lipopolysaccharide transport system ATP-binding protein
MNEQSPLLQARDIQLTYKRRHGLFKSFTHQALNGISLDIFPGETLGILGRNGEGKSSLMRILAGIVKPTAGQVNCDQHLNRTLLSIGLGFMANSTGRENALYSMMLQGTNYKRASSRLASINEFAELGEYFDQPVSTYSAGMKARLGFAVAITADVDIMFLDEILSVGDENFRKKAEETMLEKLKGNQAAVFVSHSAPQIRKVCQRAIWIEGGKIKAEGDAIWVTNKYHLYMQELLTHSS